MFGIGKVVRARLAARDEARFDRRHAQEARALRARVEAAWPQHALTPPLLREIGSYAQRHLGSAAYAPWLEVYTAWRGTFVDGWMPDNYFARFVVPHCNAGGLYRLPNTMARRVLGDDALPDIGYVIHGRLRDAGLHHVDPKRYASRIFAKYPYIYLKTAGSLRGLGVARVTPEAFADAIRQAGNAVLQYPVPIHTDLQELSPDAPATLRITTMAGQGPPVALSSVLRLGQTGVTHVKSGHNIRVPVLDLQTGTLADYGSLADWTPAASHPDTGVSFAGRHIPHMAEARAAAIRWHKRIPHIQVIGWDIAIQPDGTPILFEANGGHTDIKFAEATTGPHFQGLGFDRLHLPR